MVKEHCTALERAIARGQEGLPANETIRAYETIYFPAQQSHFASDNPRATADFIIKNDPRLENGKWRMVNGEGIHDLRFTIHHLPFTSNVET